MLLVVLATCAAGVLAGRAPAAPSGNARSALAGIPLPTRVGGECFGAAARYPANPCRNASLALTVFPAPNEAVITPNAPCTPAEEVDVLLVCAFGVPAGQAAATTALVGDSHAGHWRAALEVVAQTLRWQGLSLTRPSCPFTLAPSSLSEPRRSQCLKWTGDVIQWFAGHPWVSTIFASASHSARIFPGGPGMLARQEAGYIAAWSALPASVKHIVVIRDDPSVHGSTLSCVEHAISRHRRAGLVCAVPRGAALGRDPAVQAAARFGSNRVQVIDMTPFFCSSRLCYPVIGGALVYKDATHLTRVFATTLGPYLLRAIESLAQSWSSP
jgi:hypothetical protein